MAPSIRSTSYWPGCSFNAAFNTSLARPAGLPSLVARACRSSASAKSTAAPVSSGCARSRASMSSIRCNSPEVDVAGAPGIPTAGPMLSASACGALLPRESTCGATAAAVAPTIATAIHRSAASRAARLAFGVVMLRHLVALMRRGDVRELRQERLVVGIHAVTQQVVRALVGQPEQTIEKRSVAFCESPQVDVDDVILESSAVRKTSEIAIKNTKAFTQPGCRGRRDVRVETQQVSSRRTGEVEFRHSGQQNRHQVFATGHRNRCQRTHVEKVLQPRDFWAGVEALELAVVLGVGPIPSVFQAKRNHDFIDQWLAQSRYLQERTAIVARAILAQDAHLLPAGAGVDADVGVRRVHELRDRNLDRDGMGVVLRNRVAPGLHRKGNDVEWVERS